MDDESGQGAEKWVEEVENPRSNDYNHPTSSNGLPHKSYDTVNPDQPSSSTALPQNSSDTVNPD